MSTGAVHSMTGGLAAPDWPQLTATEVRRVLSRWGLGEGDEDLVWHSPRPLSAAAIIELHGQHLFVKRHHQSVRTGAELQEEHRFISHLQGRGAPVAGLVATGSGATTLELEDWTYEIQTVGSGQDLYRDRVSWSPFTSTAHAFSAGRALAGLHQHAHGFNAPARSARVLVSNHRIIRAREPLQVIEALAAQRPALYDYLQGKSWRSDIARALSPFHEALLEAQAPLTPLWTHNDWHASNLLWSDASETATVSAIVDFGLSDLTTAVYDLATAIERNTIPWLDIHDGIPGVADLTLVAALLRGYRSVRPLNAAELAALTAMLPVVHVGYAVTEIDYFHGTTRSMANADLAYHAFLLGHFGWFESAQGQALLHFVQRELRDLP